MERNYKLDNVKFLMLFLVVFGHMLELNYISKGVSRDIYTLIYMFHMPLMVIISGYFSRLVIDKGEDAVIKRYINLALPSLLLQILYSVTSYIFTGTIEVYWILWYTVGLIVWDYMLSTIKFRFWYLFLFITIFLLGLQDIIVNNIFGRLIYFLPFYIFGYYVDILKLIKTIKRLKFILLPFLLGVTSISLYFILDAGFGYKLFYFNYGYSSLNIDYTMGHIYRVLAYISSLGLSLLILMLVPNKQNKYISTTNTLTTFLLHGLIVKILSWTFIDMSIFNIYVSLLLTIIIVALTSHKSLFENMFKNVLEWGLEHKKIIKLIREVNIFLLVFVFAYLIQPSVLETKYKLIDYTVDVENKNVIDNIVTNELINDIELTTESVSEVIEVTSEIQDTTEIEVTTEVETTNNLETITEPKVETNTTNESIISTKPAVAEPKKIIVGTVTSTNTKRVNRVEFGTVYTITINNLLLDYSSGKLSLVKPGISNLKYEVIFEPTGDIVIKTLDGLYLAYKDNSFKLINEIYKFKYEKTEKDNYFYLKITDMYIAEKDGSLVLSENPTDIIISKYNILDKDVTYYSQLDSRWTKTKFASKTVGARGCSVVTMSMILNYFVDNKISPYDTIKLAVDNKLDRNEPPRIDLDGWVTLVNKTYGLKTKKISTNEILEELRSGNFVYLHTTTNSAIGYPNYGHLILLYGVDINGNFKFLDPYPGDILQIKEKDALQFYNSRFKNSHFTGYITKDAIDKAVNGVTVYSTWK